MRTKRSFSKVSAVLVLAAAVFTQRGAASPVAQRDEGERAGRLLRAIPEATGMSSERLQSATAVLRQFVADHKIAGAVGAVARHGKLVYLEAVGFQDVAAKTPMTPSSLFRIYSQTKAVTAVAVMILVEEGKLRLTDPASTFLPEFKNVMVQEGDSGATRRPSRAITIQDLLLHTSGLSHRTSDLYRKLQVRSRSIALPQFVINITRAPLLEDPGTRFRYSEATTVLGRIVEVVSGQPFDAFVTSRILKPLAMNDTMFWADGDARSRLTTVYQRGDDGNLRPIEVEDVPFTQKPALLEGAVGLLSTAEDFVRFSQMLLNKGELTGVRVLKADTVAAMTVNALSDRILQGKGGNVGWGLANVDVVVAPGSRGYLNAIGEYGWDGSVGTFFAVDPSNELVVTLMTQSVPANPDGLRQKFKAAVVAAIAQ
jgi:CubicO group peptidase (beta-lactamase class C family)